VVQTIKRKKPDTHGDYREYEVSNGTIRYPDGEEKTYYSHYPNYEAGRFDRPHLEAYRISVHESRREGKKVIKKQCAVATIGYYDLAGDWGLYDYINSGVNRAAEMFGVDYEVIYQLVESKVLPLTDKIKKEFHKTEEYKVRRLRDKQTADYEKAKAQFAKKYNIDPHEYDFVYNFYGELMNEEYLNQIIQQYERARSYRKSYSSNYDYSSSYATTIPSTYTETERDALKRFYRTLSKTYHPDLNPGKDTTAEMQLLNKLKEQWGI